MDRDVLDRLARIDERTGVLADQLEGIWGEITYVRRRLELHLVPREEIERRFVTKDRFWPVWAVTIGLAGLGLSTLAVAIFGNVVN